jgi:hypothetical protein
MRWILPLAALLLALTAGADSGPSWQPFVDTDVIEILTLDPGGDSRETKVWIVVLDDAGYVRTNDSRWLANIRRGSPVKLRIEEREWPVLAEETDDRDTVDRVGVMSFFRMTEPTVLRLRFDEPGPG